MPLKSLIVIAMRVYAIYWFVTSLMQILVYIPTLMAMSSSFQEGPRSGLSSFIFIPIGMLVIAVFLWFLASLLSSQVTKGHDTQLTVTSLTRIDLYRFAFVFLGIYFVLSSISATAQAAYKFFTYDFPQPDGNPQRGLFLWPFLGHGLTLVAGFACVLGANNWSKKLIHLENKNEPSSDS